MAHKKYFRAEIALVSLTVAVLILFTSIVTCRLIQEHSGAAISEESNDNDGSDDGSNITKPGGETGDSGNVDEPNTDSEPQPEDSFISLQPTVDSWLTTTNRQVGLMIYDLDHDRIAASYQPNRVFDVASVYKLFYVYDGYRQIASGAEKLNDYFTTSTDYRAGSYTIGECLDLAIRESYNGCADPLRNSTTRSLRVQKLINDLNLERTTNLGLESTASDLTKLLKLYYDHDDLPESLWRRIADSMLNQPPTMVAPNTEYDWRQGLPSGFSNQAKVYNKVGWNWNGSSWTTYADAAIVEFPALGRHYTVVVLTQNFPSYAPITKLGTLLEHVITEASSQL